MRLPTELYGVTNLAGLIVWLRTLAISIAAGWNVQHKPDGSHGVVTAESLSVSGAATVAGLLNTGQIKFPATQDASTDANTLYDYQEGTTAPTSDDITYAATSELTWVKIGTLVTVTYRLVWPATADANQAEFDLPVPSGSAASNRGGTVCNTNTTGSTVAFVVTGQKALLRSISGAAVTNATQSGQTVLGELSYHAAS